MKIKDTIKIELIYDRITDGCHFSAKGLRAGDEKLLYKIMSQFAQIADSHKFRNALIERAFSKKFYKSKNPNVAPIWRKESGRPLKF